MTSARNRRVDPFQPTRSAGTVAGVSGVSASNAHTRDLNVVNDVGTGLRSYLGGLSELTALITLVIESSDPMAGNRRLRHAHCRKPPDQRPVLHSDHTPIVGRVFTSRAPSPSSFILRRHVGVGSAFLPTGPPWAQVQRPPFHCGFDEPTLPSAVRGLSTSMRLRWNDSPV